MTMQLIGKEDSVSGVTAEVMRERWHQYIDSFVSVSLQTLPSLSLSSAETFYPSQAENTVGVPREKVRKPFLPRNLPRLLPTQPDSNLVSHDDFGIKICIRTYKMFCTDDSEDFLWRFLSPRTPAESKRVEKVEGRRSEWLKKALMSQNEGSGEMVSSV